MRVVLVMSEVHPVVELDHYTSVFYPELFDGIIVGVDNKQV